MVFLSRELGFQMIFFLSGLKLNLKLLNYQNFFFFINTKSRRQISFFFFYGFRETVVNLFKAAQKKNGRRVATTCDSRFDKENSKWRTYDFDFPLEKAQFFFFSLNFQECLEISFFSFYRKLIEGIVD